MRDWSAGDIISGERLQAVAEVTLITPPILGFHQSLRSLGIRNVLLVPGSGTDLAVTPQLIEALRNRRSIFVYTHLLEAFAARILPLLDHRFVLITHNSDHGIDERFVPLLDDARVVHHFAQNVLITHPKLTALPIGIGNAQWPHGQVDQLLAAVAARPPAQRDIVYCNFMVATNPDLRGPLLQRLANAEGVWHAPTRNFRDYLVDMAGCRWCISPPGNGVDCHRTWEALYMGVIPIVQKSAAGAGLHDGLPILQVEDLGAVTAAVAAREIFVSDPAQMARATMGYWQARIAEAVASTG